MTTYDVAVIGGGILGLATARELLLRDPGTRVVVLEKEDRIAGHQTGHNSGVIHSGIYYRPGSAKARFCVAGAAAMRAFCDERAIPYRRIGKLIVAAQADELSALDALEGRGAANGVGTVTRLDARSLREIEPALTGLAALHLPEVAVVDFAAVAEVLRADVVAAGGEVRLRSGVAAITVTAAGVTLATASGPVACGQVIACAGLGGDALARAVGAAPALRIVPFRGDYYRLAPARRDLVRGLIYPVPDPRFPFLGVHFTPRIDGDVWLGPNAVLAFGLEAYRRSDVDVRQTLGILGDPGFRRMAGRYWRTGLGELVRDYSKRRFLASLRRYLPGLTLADLLPGPSGIRAQAVDRAGTLVDDFWFEALPRVLLVRNAPSPAATASLVLAREIVDRARAA